MWSRKIPVKLYNCSARGWFRKPSSIDPSDLALNPFDHGRWNVSVCWTCHRSRNCVGRPISGSTRGIVLSCRWTWFLADLPFLDGFPDKSSRVWFRSVFWRLEPWKSFRISITVDFIMDICFGVNAGSLSSLKESSTACGDKRSVLYYLHVYSAGLRNASWNCLEHI